MERKKMTKTLIGESLKVLMRDYPFEKITIKMITNEAGVIRPTFYNYFCDKYEVLEWIFSENIIDNVKAMFDQKMYAEGVKLLFVSMKNDSDFYKKAFEVTGQNAFSDIVIKYLKQLFKEALPFKVKGINNNPLLTGDLVASYYAMALTHLLEMWLHDSFEQCNAEHMVDAYEYLMRHNLEDYISVS